MKKLFPLALLASVLLVAGCQDTKKVAELQKQVNKLTQQVADLTAERDSLNEVITRILARKSPSGS